MDEVIPPLLMARLLAIRGILLKQGSITCSKDRKTASCRLRYNFKKSTGGYGRVGINLGPVEVADAVRHLINTWRLEEIEEPGDPEKTDLENMMAQFLTVYLGKTSSTGRKKHARPYALRGGLW